MAASSEGPVVLVLLKQAARARRHSGRFSWTPSNGDEVRHGKYRESHSNAARSVRVNVVLRACSALSRNGVTASGNVSEVNTFVELYDDRGHFCLQAVFRVPCTAPHLDRDIR